MTVFLGYRVRCTLSAGCVAAMAAKHSECGETKDEQKERVRLHIYSIDATRLAKGLDFQHRFGKNGKDVLCGKARYI